MTKWDKILIMAVLLLSVGGFFLVFQMTSNSDHLYLVIEVNGEEYKKISLSDNTPKQIIELNVQNKHNKVEIEGKKVRFIEADCRDQLCIKAGWLNRANQTSICLPNKVSIKLMSNDSELDIISY